LNSAPDCAVSTCKITLSASLSNLFFSSAL
jgi:hypothetical protein